MTGNLVTSVPGTIFSSFTPLIIRYASLCRMSAESEDAYKVYKAKPAVKGEKKDIAADEAKLKADQKK